MEHPDLEYVGFWRRFAASLIDTVLLMPIVYALAVMVYGPGYFLDTRLVKGGADFMISWVLPAVLVIWLWVIWSGQTPGKRVMGARIVDAETGGPVSTKQAIIRYLGYYVSMLGLFFGFFWVGFDPKKQGWHDHMAGTVVVRKKASSTVTFAKG
jgi:uncharacterized RDD family membrane protein YckC